MSAPPETSVSSISAAVRFSLKCSSDTGAGVHSATDEELGLVAHPAPNLEPGDVVGLADGREALVVARVETDGDEVAALLEVVPAPQRGPRAGAAITAPNTRERRF